MKQEHAKTANQENYNLWALLHQVSDIIFNSIEKELGEESSQYGFSATQAEVLFAIKAIGTRTERAMPAQIARMIFRRAHSVAGILDRMEKTGLIKRSRGSGQKNWVKIILTKEGEQAYSKALRKKSVQRIMSVLSVDDHEKLRTILEALRSKGLKELGLDAKKLPAPRLM